MAGDFHGFLLLFFLDLVAEESSGKEWEKMTEKQDKGRNGQIVENFGKKMGVIPKSLFLESL